MGRIIADIKLIDLASFWIIIAKDARFPLGKNMLTGHPIQRTTYFRFSDETGKCSPREVSAAIDRHTRF